MPVGAHSATRELNSLRYFSRSCLMIALSRKVFPVPALPVKNTFLPCSTICSTCSCARARAGDAKLKHPVLSHIQRKQIISLRAIST
eukprot:284920-Chlamydomonas_euryale.AAC.10